MQALTAAISDFALTAWKMCRNMEEYKRNTAILIKNPKNPSDSYN